MILTEEKLIKEKIEKIIDSLLISLKSYEYFKTEVEFNYDELTKHYVAKIHLKNYKPLQYYIKIVSKENIYCNSSDLEKYYITVFSGDIEVLEPVTTSLKSKSENSIKKVLNFVIDNNFEMNNKVHLAKHFCNLMNDLKIKNELEYKGDLLFNQEIGANKTFKEPINMSVKIMNNSLYKIEIKKFSDVTSMEKTTEFMKYLNNRLNNEQNDVLINFLSKDKFKIKGIFYLQISEIEYFMKNFIFTQKID